MTASLDILEAKAALFARRFGREFPNCHVAVLAFERDPSFLLLVKGADHHLLAHVSWRIGNAPSLRAVRWLVAEAEHARAQRLRAFRAAERAYCAELRGTP